MYSRFARADAAKGYYPHPSRGSPGGICPEGLHMVPTAFPTDKNKKQNEKGVSLAIKQWGMGVICISDYLSISACEYEKNKKDFKRNSESHQHQHRIALRPLQFG